ncbi:pyridoxamine 5'-phosphate oxidase family protein [Parasedimentitalea psychrophila]|uniref:Pyridoxamine 5'-phosphate oxidase family protein n=1 Tax=Parasedimentitalea psychrophila TaxID=2997337 RepID=A0A9Y2L2E1_9RHOB|nr:pyridoxamine 5'-phosphate oxidase family protein [Parasedimentitalea psychrophila]WIY26107.1 pyridoxamine 5'-phosphate oxidase family protein [Parasedimentitalea psychrophila]
MALAFADIAFTPSVRAEQDRRGSAKTYGKFLSDERWGGDRIGPEEAAFLTDRDGFFQASTSETGWPYVQFRGGTPGFVKILDDKTIAYADYRGNRQYISTGNLAHSNRISIIAMDYPNQRRLKLWGEVEFIDPEEDPDLLAQLHSGKEIVERIVKITVSAFDWNCPRHIPRRFTLEELEPELSTLRDRLAELEAENAQLKRQH